MNGDGILEALALLAFFGVLLLAVGLLLVNGMTW